MSDRNQFADTPTEVYMLLKEDSVQTKEVLANQTGYWEIL